MTHGVLVVLVRLLYAGTATEHGVSASGIETDHVEDLSEMVALLLTGQVFNLGGSLHINYQRIPRFISYLLNSCKVNHGTHPGGMEPDGNRTPRTQYAS